MNKLRDLLERLAAWYLQGKVIGVVNSVGPNVADPMNVVKGWIHGKNWYIYWNIVPTTIGKKQ